MSSSSSNVDADMFEARGNGDGGQQRATGILRATDLSGVHVLKQENLFLLCDDHGDIRPDGRGLGLYDGDTRFLSRYDLLLNGARPVVLRAGPTAAFEATIQLTNPDLAGDRDA